MRRMDARIGHTMSRNAYVDLAAAAERLLDEVGRRAGGDAPAARQRDPLRAPGQSGPRHGDEARAGGAATLAVARREPAGVRGGRAATRGPPRKDGRPRRRARSSRQSVRADENYWHGG